MDDVLVIYYDIENNVMMDDEGYPIFDIFELITPSQLFLFKYEKQSVTVLKVSGEGWVEMLYPEEE